MVFEHFSEESLRRSSWYLIVSETHVAVVVFPEVVGVISCIMWIQIERRRNRVDAVLILEIIAFKKRHSFCHSVVVPNFLLMVDKSGDIVRPVRDVIISVSYSVGPGYPGGVMFCPGLISHMRLSKGDHLYSLRRNIAHGGKPSRCEGSQGPAKGMACYAHLITGVLVLKVHEIISEPSFPQ